MNYFLYSFPVMAVQKLLKSIKICQLYSIYCNVFMAQCVTNIHIS